VQDITFQKEKIDVEKAIARCGSEADGAVVSFVGV
jgi:molybdopterin synthase catalytic subunit